MSLKPPWKQKNPVMEKACQAYHKQTAPAKAVEILKNLKAKDLATGEVWSEKKIFYNTESDRWDISLVSFLKKGEVGTYPQLVARIEVRKTVKGSRIHAAKLMPHPCGLYYKGERILRFSAGTGGGYKKIRGFAEE